MCAVHAVILAGGSGTRFWPASRAGRPKQFLPLAHGQPLIEAAVRRAEAVATAERTWIVTNQRQADALPEVFDFPREQLLIEPEARDTAPCVALATAHIAARDPDATLLMMPADHLIEPLDAFCALMDQAVQVAADDQTLVTFGITPTYPSTEYGYIETGAALAGDVGHDVVRFREKPNRETAAEFLDAGNFRWNSGIFVWRPQALWSAMQAGAPELASIATEMLDAARNANEDAFYAAFRRAPKQSIDYAVMEHAPKVAVLDAAFQWFDLGSFTALDAIAPRDDRGNLSVTFGGHTVAHDSDNCVLYADGPRTVAVSGVQDLIVVAVEDAVMVCPKSRADRLKELVTHLRETGRTDLL